MLAGIGPPPGIDGRPPDDRPHVAIPPRLGIAPPLRSAARTIKEDRPLVGTEVSASGQLLSFS